MGQPLTDREATIQDVEGAASGTPIARAGRVVTPSSTFQTVTSWTVAALSDGDLHQVAMFSDSFVRTEFRLTIDSVIQFTIQIGSSLGLPWRINRLSAGAIVLLEARSTDGNTVTVDGAITGAERT